MQITTERLEDGSVVLIDLDGELDAANFESVIDAVRPIAAAGARTLLIDLSGVPYMGSSGLVALHSAAMLMRGQEPPSPEHGWSAFHQLGEDAEAETGPEPVVLIGPQPPVARVLDRSGLTRIFSIYPDRETALRASASAAG